MKHSKKVIGVLLLVAVPMLAWAGIGHAQRFSSSVDKGEVVQSSLYSSGKNVTVKGEIFGDVFCAGQKIHVDATVHGDVLCAGMDITIAGKVDGDIRAAGQTVSVSAEVGKNASLAGSDVSLDADATIGQDLSAAGSKVNIKGSVGRDVAANGSTVILNGMVGRNVRASGSTINLKDGANVAGDLTYTSNQKAQFANGSAVAGKTQQTAPDQRKGYRFDLRFYLFVVVGMILLLMALASLFPRFLQRSSEQIKKSFFKSLAVGALGTLALAALMAVLLFTVVGIPMGIALLLGFLFGAALSAPISAYYVGRLVFNDKANPVVIAATGAFILGTTYFLPWLGFLFVIVAYGVGFGALLLELKAHTGRGDDGELDVPAPPAKGKHKKTKAAAA